MKCVLCGGELRHETVTFSYEDGEMHILVEHVPADVCSRCGERMYAPEVTDALLRLARQQSEHVRTVQIPVYDFSKAAAAQEGRASG